MFVQNLLVCSRVRALFGTPWPLSSLKKGLYIKKEFVEDFNWLSIDRDLSIMYDISVCGWPID